MDWRQGLGRLALLLHLVAPLIFFTRSTENPYSIQIFVLFLGLSAALAWSAFWLWRPGPIPLVRTNLDGPLLLFGLWAFVTVLISAAKHGPFFRPGIEQEGLKGLLFLWVNGLGVFWLSTQVAGTPQSCSIRRVMLGAAGVSAGYGILQYFGFDPIWGPNAGPFQGRPISTYGNPNFLSSALALLMPVALRECLTASRPASAIGWGSFSLLLVGGLTATLTRSSWIGATAGILFYITLDFNTLKSAGRRFMAWAGASLAVALLWPAGGMGGVSPLARLGELWVGVTGGGTYVSWHQRLLIWRSAWDMWSETPWTGKGWGAFELFYPLYQGRLLSRDLFLGFRTHANNAHQLILELGSQTGIIGLGLFFWILLLTRVTHARKTRTGVAPPQAWGGAFLAGLGAMAVDNLFGNVSAFFAVPAFLFFWIAGQWAGLMTGRLTSVSNRMGLRRWGAVACGLLAFGLTLRETRRFVAQTHSFRASQTRAALSDRSREQDLLRAQWWYRFDVHSAYDLGVLYSRRMEAAERQGFLEETRSNARKAVDAYTNALHANPSYDEIFFARAMARQRLGESLQAVQDLRLAILINPLEPSYADALNALVGAVGPMAHQLPSEL